MADSDKITLAAGISQKDAELNSRITKHFEEAKEFINRRRQNLEEYEDFYEGRQWKRATKRPVENVIFQTIETAVPILTDSQPAADIIPLEVQHTEVAEVLSAAMKSEFRYNNLIIKWSQGVRNALKTGTGWFYVDWDPDLENGLGHVVIKVLDWRNIFIDPLASDIDDADFVGIRFPMRLDQVKRRFPSKKALLEAQYGIGRIDEFSATEAPDEEREKQWTGHNSGDVHRVNKLDIVRDVIHLEEAWLKDYSQEKIPEEETAEEIERENEQFAAMESPEARKGEDHVAHILGHTAQLEELVSDAKLLTAEVMGIDLEAVDEEQMELATPQLPELEALTLQIKLLEDHIETHNIWGEQNPDGKRSKYPNNLRLVVRVGDVILFDGKPPVDDGKVPLVPIYAYKNEDSVYGTGEIQNILHQQKVLNEMSYAELQGLRVNANSGWVKDDNSGVSSDELTNEQGIVITKKQGTEVTRLPPGEVSPQFQVKMNDQRRAINDVVGLQDASQGRRPAGVVSGEAIDSLKQSNLTRIREKSRILEGYSALRLGWLVTARIVKYWSNSRKLLLHNQNGELKRFDFDPERIEDLRYDVLVVPGSTAGMDKDLIFMRSFQMLQAGVIDAVTFVEIVDLPFKAHVLKKVREAQEMQQAQMDQTALIEQLAAENEELKALIEQASQVEPGGKVQPVRQAPAV